MPPRCCSFLQIHTAISALTESEISAYRAKLDEWITLDKIYCPAPTCSAFIPERLVPTPDSSETQPRLQAVLAEIVERLIASPPARFFRGELDITHLPGYSNVIANHIDLTSVEAHAKASQYNSADDLTRDIELIVSNAKAYNLPGHPISNTADELFALYLKELSAAMDRLVSAAGSTKARDMFTCPKCHLGICTKCKQVEHGSSACDTTAQDYEVAMLETFKYKRCPLCKHAVRKMFGCSHMQCVCGAHFCYWCQKSIYECDGGCEARDESEDEDDEDEFGDDVEEEELDELVEREMVRLEEAAGTRADGPAATHDSLPQASREVQADPPTRIVNLDAGGSRRWGEADVDFGHEPDDDGIAQIWSCPHYFDVYRPKNDDYDHGDETRMECNRCFVKVLPAPKMQVPTSTKKRRFRGFDSAKILVTPFKTPSATPTPIAISEQTAHECRECRLVVCEGCRKKHHAREKARDS